MGHSRPNSAAALRARALLHALADSTGGRVFEPSASKKLAAIYNSILDELGSQYVLGYATDNMTPDGKYRTITVKAKSAALKLRHRKGYMAPEPPTQAKKQ
jgi:VWFA-related protein